MQAAEMLGYLRHHPAPMRSFLRLAFVRPMPLEVVVRLSHAFVLVALLPSRPRLRSRSARQRAGTRFARAGWNGSGARCRSGCLQTPAESACLRGRIDQLTAF